MTRVDFYLLPTLDPDQRLRFACKLADKAFASQRRLHILTTDRAECSTLDHLLWTHQDISFLPHAISDSADLNYPITLGYTHESLAGADVLINLSPEIPAQLEQFRQVAEIVDEDSQRKAAARLHYRLYRERGCDLQHHKMEPVT